MGGTKLGFLGAGFPTPVVYYSKTKNTATVTHCNITVYYKKRVVPKTFVLVKEPKTFVLVGGGVANVVTVY